MQRVNGALAVPLAAVLMLELALALALAAVLERRVAGVDVSRGEDEGAAARHDGARGGITASRQEGRLGGGGGHVQA